MGKRLNTYFALNNSPEVLLSQVSYDPYGRMVSQAQGGHTSSYTYNIRSWLTEISNPYFLQRMQYQDVGSASQWGGNIAKMSWSAGPSATLNYYQYTYDGVSRLSSALYNGSATSMYSRSYAYDLNSNVTSVAMGQNTLSFDLSGNRLSNGTYDSKGRLTSNTISQSVTSITYNPLDLPMQIVLSGNKGIENKYLADGSKLQSRLCSPGDTLTKVYIGNLILHNGQLHTLLTENGYIDFTGSTPQYRYFIKDHLGNNRVVTDSFGNVLQRNNYAPYGNPLAASSEATPYQYGGKEKIWSATLDWYDYCARYYQPILGRFTTIDPMSEKYYSISPYAYCAGNPVNLVDVDGMQWYSYKDENGDTQYVYSEGAIIEREQYKNLEYVGYTYHDLETNKYYSLFGQILDWVDSNGGAGLGQLYDRIDRLIITFANNHADSATGESNKVRMHIKGMPMGENRDFVYKGQTFTTIPVNDGMSGESLYDGNVFWNVEPDNSPSTILFMPTKSRPINVHTKVFRRYWLTATNPDKGVGYGFQTLQLRFSSADAKMFIQSYNNIFQGHPYNH